ncbi:MAG: UGSC family (seleno)protein [Acidimicrobiales bacterium]
MAEKLTVLNPEGSAPQVAGKALAPRSSELAQKTVFLVDVGFENSGDFMEQLGKWFADNQPEVTTKILRLNEPFNPDPASYARIAEEGDAAVLGVGL